MTTPAQKAAIKKYQDKHIASVACRVSKEQAERFKAYAVEHNTTANALLKQYILSCIGDPEK